MMRRLTGATPLTLLCVIVIVTGCGTGSGARHSTRLIAGFRTCPRNVQEIRRTPASTPPGGALVPRDPIAAELCIYTDEGPKGTVRPLPLLQWSALLSQARARTLTLMLDTRGGRGPSCDAGYQVLTRLRYRNARSISALAAGCDPELLSTPTGVNVLSPTASLAVGGLLNPLLSDGGRVTRVSDYIGQPLAPAALAAQRVLRPAGDVVSAYEINDARAPFGHVVWQIPLPGTKQDVGSGSMELIVATRRAPRCRATQLLGRYWDGGNATQDHFGNIALLDTSPEACTLEGRLTLHGVGADGRADTKTVSEPIGPALVLSPRTSTRMLEHQPATALIAAFGFAGGADGPQGPCYDTFPRAWSIALSTNVTLRIANGGAGAGGPFYSCRGSLSFGLSSGVHLL
jgi:hypothetical protein